MSEPKIEPNFTLGEISRTSLLAGISSPHWNALEKQLAKALLDSLEHAPSSPAAPTPRDKCPQCGSEDRDMPHVGGFQGSLGWINSDQGYDVCVHSWHSSSAAPTPLRDESKGRHGWIDSVAFQHELGRTPAKEVAVFPQEIADILAVPLCCENPNMVVKGVCSGSDRLHQKNRMHDDKTPTYEKCEYWRPTHNVCLNCGKEEAL